MTQAQVYDVVALIGLAIAFAGAWMVFGLGAAIIVLGWLTWCTALYGLHLLAARRG